VWLRVPKKIRMQRIYSRSYGKFGDRILPGGDLHEQEKQFFTMAQDRTEAEVEDWLRTLSIPVTQADGTLPIAENVEFLRQVLAGGE